MPEKKLRQGDALRIGQYLYVSKTELKKDREGKRDREHEDEEKRYNKVDGKDLFTPSEWPGRPEKKDRPSPKEFDDWMTELHKWSADYLSEVWSHFTLFARFTLNGKVVADRVNIGNALGQVDEIHPETKQRHVSAQLSQASLSQALVRVSRNQKTVSWNDLHEIRVLRNKKTFPDGKKGELLKDVVERIPNQTLDIDFMIEGVITEKVR